MERELTARQAQLVDFIRLEIETKQRSPSLREIGSHFGMAAPSVADHLDAIEAKGFIYRTPGERRNIRLGADAMRVPRTSMLPLLGRIAAGTPLLAPTNISGWHPIAPHLFRPKASFLMTVRGDSMIDLGIHESDLVAIHRQDVATSGQIVMAVLTDRATGEHEVTLKRLRVEPNRYLLLSENRAAGYAPIVIPRKERHDDAPEFQISGIYCGHLHFGAGGDT